MALPLEQLEGKYEILEKIREGGMGAIYKVRHVLLGEIRVVKVMRSDLADREEAQERFIREARSAIRLRHPNIAQLHDFSLDDDGTGLIVMEFIDGLSFQDVLKSHGPPGLALALEMALQSLRALEYLHRLGYVHRDISPDNLMLTRDVDGEPLVKLIDLGIAKGRASGDPGVTSTGTVLGKIRYAAPENFKSGSASVGARADLYSFGIVLYELLTGAYPIRGRDLNTILAGHLVQPVLNFDEVDPDGKVPGDLRKVVAQALEKDPGKRIASAERFWKQLHDVRKHHPPAPMPGGLLESILAGSPRQDGEGHPSPGTTQGLLDREFPPEDTGSAPRPAHLEATGPQPQEPPEPLRGSGLIERAWDLFDVGDLDESQRLLDEGLKATPDHPAERGLGQKIAAARAQRQHAASEANREKSRRLIELAADAFEDRDYDTCESLLLDAAKADPTDPLPREEIARLREIKERLEQDRQSQEREERERKAREQNEARKTTAPTVSVPVEEQPAPPAFPAPPQASSEPKPAPKVRGDGRSPATQVVPQQRATRKPVVLQATELREPETPSDQPKTPRPKPSEPQARAAPPARPVPSSKAQPPGSSATKRGPSLWVWLLPLAVVVALGVSLAIWWFGRKDGSGADGGNEPPPVEQGAVDPGDPSSAADLDAAGDPADDDVSSATTPEDGGEESESESNTVSLTETFPILRTESRDEAFSLLRRAQAQGIRATVSRNPSDPLPYALEAGPHETSEVARQQARRARTLLGLDRPRQTQTRNDPPPPRESTPEKSEPEPDPGPAADPKTEDEQDRPTVEDEPPTIDVPIETPEPPDELIEPAVPRGDDPIPVTGDVVKPELIDGPPPVYTRMARRARLEGVVVLRTVIDETGRVVDATVLKGLPMGLNQSALNAVKTWRYRPAMLQGEPVKVTFNVAVTFRLQ